MSFLDEITAKSKHLKKVETKVTCVDGRVYKESDRGLARKSVEQQEDCLLEEGLFFVIDTKPDDLAQEVLPGLFIGSQEVASNFSELGKHGIKAILNVAVGVSQIHYQNVDYKSMPIFDLPDFDIRACFEEALDFITRSMEKCPVLVHCNAGISRSATIIAAYLIREKEMTFSEALKLIKDARPAARPNEGFIKQLVSYEKEQRMNVAVNSRSHSSTPH